MFHVLGAVSNRTGKRNSDAFDQRKKQIPASFEPFRFIVNEVQLSSVFTATKVVMCSGFCWYLTVPSTRKKNERRIANEHIQGNVLKNYTERRIFRIQERH